MLIHKFPRLDTSMTYQSGKDVYFPYEIQIPAHCWHSLDLHSVSWSIDKHGMPRILFFRQLAYGLNKQRPPGVAPVHAGELNLYASLLRAFRFLIQSAADGPSLTSSLAHSGISPAGPEMKVAALRFVELYPPADILSGASDISSWLEPDPLPEKRTDQILLEMLLLRLAADNPALTNFRELVDDSPLTESPHYASIVNSLCLELENGPTVKGRRITLLDTLLTVINSSPSSLAGQVAYIRKQWETLLPPEIIQECETAIDIIQEELRERGSAGGDPGPSPVLEFGGGADQAGKIRHGLGGEAIFNGFDYPEYEHFSPDADWMSNVVLMAKMVYVWLDQLSRQHGYPITRLDQVPDSELDSLASRGFTGLWLIGIWDRSPASQRIKQICGNPDAIASAYSLFDYEVAADIGGWEGLANLRDRALKRGIRLASDMVPNHTGIYSRWVLQHPDWFVQTDYPPFPTYQFNGADLSCDCNVSIQIEDGYWTKSDAAVVFRHYDRRANRTRYIYHGNDGTSIPWNDTAQLNYLIPEVREAVIQTILHVARNFPIIRFDAAMTLAKKHFQRLWFPLRGHGGGIPSRAEHGMSKEEFDSVFPVEFWREVVDRVAVEAPGTLLLAEAFWMMEGYFVRTLGMHRVYNSAFMNMLKTEENAKYRQTIKNVLAFNHEILKRFVNFMNNPDEKTAVAQFGSQGKYFGACVLLATMPGLPMIGHGQIEGFHEKYGMEYKRAYWDEQIDDGLVKGHEMWIFPLFRRRWLFSGSENFVLYDFHSGDSINDNVFAYSNKADGQSALILFNNCHALTSGWIRESVVFAASTEQPEASLRRTSLNEALGLGNDKNTFVIFRDLTRNLEYLRSAAELSKKGLYVELSEYQFHVFLDFRLVQDDPQGSWSKLYKHLSGTGSISLDNERKQLEYGRLNFLFRNILKLIPLSGVRRNSGLSVDDLPQLIDDFKTELSSTSLKRGGDTVCPEPTGISHKKRLSDGGALVSSLDNLQRFLRQKPTKREAQQFQSRAAHRFTDQAATRLVLAWLILRDTDVDPTSFGLDWTLCQLLAKDHDRDLHCRCSQLLTALLEWWRSAACTDSRRSNPGIIVPDMFTLPSCRSYLLVHFSGGIEWFNKERFEELYEWLELLNLLDKIATVNTDRALCSRMAAAESAITGTIELAANSGYRCAVFVNTVKSAKSSGTAFDKLSR